MDKVSLFLINPGKKSYELGFKVNNEEYLIKVSEDLIIKYKLFRKQDIDYLVYKEIMDFIPLDSLYLKSISLLNKRMYSIKEFKDKLLAFTSSISDIDSVIDILIKKNLLNDDLYKESLLEDYIYNKRYGNNEIYYRLSNLHLNPYFTYPIDALKDNIKYLINKENRKYKEGSKVSKEVFIKRALLRKGYKEEDINRYYEYKLLEVK